LSDLDVRTALSAGDAAVEQSARIAVLVLGAAPMARKRVAQTGVSIAGGAGRAGRVTPAAGAARARRSRADPRVDQRCATGRAFSSREAQKAREDRHPHAPSLAGTVLWRWRMGLGSLRRTLPRAFLEAHHLEVQLPALQID